MKLYFRLLRTFGVHQWERRDSVVVSTSTWHAAGRGFDPWTMHVILGVKTWPSTLATILWGMVAHCFQTWASSFTLPHIALPFG